MRRIQRTRYVDSEQSKKQVNGAPGYTISDQTAFSGYVIIMNKLLDSVYHPDKTFGWEVFHNEWDILTNWLFEASWCSKTRQVWGWRSQRVQIRGKKVWVDKKQAFSWIQDALHLLGAKSFRETEISYPDVLEFK